MEQTGYVTISENDLPKLEEKIIKYLPKVFYVHDRDSLIQAFTGSPLYTQHSKLEDESNLRALLGPDTGNNTEDPCSFSTATYALGIIWSL